jgi:hypothetical protein
MKTTHALQAAADAVERRAPLPGAPEHAWRRLRTVLAVAEEYGLSSAQIVDELVRRRVAREAPRQPGDRVIVQPTHWNPRRHGAVGTVFSRATSAQGCPTHYVTFDHGGEFVHAADLRGVEPVR